MTDCIILAAGRGNRLMPFTEDRPKAMVEVKGKPIIKWIFEALEPFKLDIEKVFIIIGYKGGKIKTYIKYNYPGRSIEFIHQKNRTGTADAIYLTKDKISDDFIVLSGDIIPKQSEIKDLMRGENSMLFTEKSNRLYEYGTIDKGNPLVDGGWKIKFINEKSSRPTSHYVNGGSYHFNRSVFDYIKMTPYDSRFGEKIITNTINIMIDNGIKFSGFWIDSLNEISYPEDIEDIGNKL